MEPFVRDGHPHVVVLDEDSLPIVDADAESEENSLTIVPGLAMPGQRMHIGTRNPPSQFVAFSPLNVVLAPSGQLSTSAPSSVV
jgi:hypothetical protein